MSFLTKEENQERIRRQVRGIRAVVVNGYLARCDHIECDECPAWMDPDVEGEQCFISYLRTEVLPYLVGSSDVGDYKHSCVDAQMSMQDVEFLVRRLYDIVRGDTGCYYARWTCSVCPAHYHLNPETRWCLFTHIRDVFADRLPNFKKP